jgi:hypothetical protein
MNKLSVLVNRYNSTSKSKGIVPYYIIDATSKWAEYSIDEVKIKALMQGVDFNEKFNAELALKNVRRKIDYMYKHRNFDLASATAYYKKLKRAINY